MKPIIPFEPVRSETIPVDQDWVYQVKWDGVRILAYNEGSGTTLFNRKRRERTLHYPELTTRPWCRADSFVADGEVIALAADGKPSFHEVMRRDGLRRMERVKEVRQFVPITYMVFDLLYLNGKWIHTEPLRERQRLLADILLPNEHVQPVASYAEGEALYRTIQQQNMEGVVCKDLNSSYLFDGKDGRWVKVKNYGDVIAVIGGFTTNGGIVNAVLAGLYNDNGQLLFIGKVGTGKLTAADWRELTAELKGMETAVCPFASRHPDMKGACWVQPRLTAKIRYTEWRRHEGRTLRQPSIQSFVQARPEECTFEVQ